jgi:hypothetical protein
MNEHKYSSDYGEVECSYFFDADGGDGIDISVDGEHVGEVWGVDIPDEFYEEEDILLFEERIDEWLSSNY